MAEVASDGAGLIPIGGVSLRLYAEVSRAAADAELERVSLTELASARGIAGDDWQAAAEGWNTKMRHDPTVGRLFHRFFAGDDPERPVAPTDPGARTPRSGPDPGRSADDRGQRCVEDRGARRGSRPGPPA